MIPDGWVEYALGHATQIIDCKHRTPLYVVVGIPLISPGTIKWGAIDFPFKAKSSAMKLLTAKQGVSIKYIFETMQMINYSVGGHQRHWISIYSNLVVNLPSIEEQQKIASVLSSTDQEIETWQATAEHLKHEKKALMQQLLTGKRRVMIDVIHKGVK